jgi:DNA-binding NtrC family response regulator
LEKLERILIVDDDPQMRRTTKRILQQQGYVNFGEAERGEDLENLFAEGAADLVLLDLAMPGRGGIKTLEWSLQEHADVPVVIVSGRLEPELMLNALKLGAYDFITKPFENIRLITTVEKAFQHRRDKLDIINLQGQLYKDSPDDEGPFRSILTTCPSMRRLFVYAESAARSNRDILITEETGTGKDLLARAVHTISGRPGEYVAVNAAGLDDQLFADTLFGHTEGAFTGAQGKRSGLIELAKHGTLFLDEIGDLSISSQVKLLRVLQEREYMPLGSDRPIKTTARIIAATSVNLGKKMEEDSFRKDLYFRLRAHHLHIPPLRERLGDIRLLFEHFLTECCKECHKTLKEPLTPHAYALLESYPFLGNIRELEAMVYDLVYHMQEDHLTLLDIKNAIDVKQIRGKGMSAPISSMTTSAVSSSSDLLKNIEVETHLNNFTSSNQTVQGITFPNPLPTVDNTTDALILESLKRNDGNKSRAALTIGMSRKGFINRLAKIKGEEFGAYSSEQDENAE